MRLTCELEVGNRLLPSLNISSRKKATHATLVLGKTSTESNSAGIGILLCSAQNRNGTKYKVHQNILKVFSKYIAEGKATIAFKEPPHDIHIRKADVLQLKSFLHAIRLVTETDNSEKIKFPNLRPATAAQVTKPKKRLIITSRKEYPDFGKSFPSSLEILKISDCLLARIESRILTLRNLKILDLSNNKLKALPELNNSKHLPNLTDLNLSNNELTEIPSSFFCMNFHTSLLSFNVSNNHLHSLPDILCDLKCLTTLRINNNNISKLPERIYLLRSLRELNAANNNLSSLPGNFMKLRLDLIDLFGNPMELNNTDNVVHFNLTTPPSLFEISARSIRNAKLAFSEDEVPTRLQTYLNDCHWCICGRSCFESYNVIIKPCDLGKIAMSVCLPYQTLNRLIPLEMYTCSLRCFSKIYKSVK